MMCALLRLRQLWRMMHRFAWVVCGLVFLGSMVAVVGVSAGQDADLTGVPEVAVPTYAVSAGPRVAIDEAHHNFHTMDGRYRPCAELLRRDGYRVTAFRAAFSAAALADVDILVISNPLHASNVDNWRLPTPSAFTEAEIEAMQTWIRSGGAMLLILDHMPFPGAGDALARAFGFQFSNGFATLKAQPPSTICFARGRGLRESALTCGRGDGDQVDQVASFTGSAFRAPEGACPVLVFDDRFESLEPARAWQFDAKTPSISLEGWCQGAIMAFGQGRVAVFGEAAMFTAQVTAPGRGRAGMNTPEGAQNARLLLNIMRWLSAAQSSCAD